LLTDRIRELVARREAGERRELEALRSEARASVSLTTEQVFTVFLGALVLLSLGWVVIARSITRPIRQLSAFAENFGKGANPAPLRMRGEDEISRLASTIREMAERRRRIEQDLRVLSEAGTWLGTSLDYQGVLRHAVQMAIPQFAGGTAIDILDRERGELRREAAGHSDPEIARQAFEMGIRAPVSIDGNNPLARVFRSGKSVIFEDLRKEGYGVIARSPEHLELLRKNQPKSAICVLLRARGMSFGVMVFYSFDRTYGQQDLFLAEALGRRTALALDNARLYEQAQKAVRTREEVLAIVSHDLRNPLASLRMSCEMIGRLAPEGGRGETFRRVAERGLRATDFMSRMISDLLDAATIESGRLSISPATESLCSIIQESILNVLPGALEKEILIESPADTGLTVWADRQRLVQVLANLLNNAVKFSPRESHVRVDVSWQGDSARVAVRDEGPGMEPGTVAQLFQRFWRPSDVPGKGAGLGLYIAKGLVEAHGGRIWVESAPNRGSTFFFSVPTRAAARAAS
jgi:signal transduction histidine kinase